MTLFPDILLCACSHKSFLRLLIVLALSGLVAPPAAAQGLLHTLTSPSPEAGGSLGTSVADVPDTDGDGAADLLVGAPGEHASAPGAGRAYLFSGADGSLLHALTSPNAEFDGQFSRFVAGVPDADGDGAGDLLIGAWHEDGGSDGAGRAYLFSGATGNLILTLTSPHAETNGGFGHAVEGVWDVDGDGRGDLLVGAHAEDGGAQNAGRAYLFSGANGTLLHTLTSPNAAVMGLFGEAVAGVPDTDGDGRDDLLVGARNEGSERTYLFSGATGALLHTLEAPNSEGSFGFSVAGTPDADGDGAGDLLVGAPWEKVGAFGVGRAYLFSGASGNLLLTLNSPNPEGNGHFSNSVAGVPDADGDGRGDLLLGARQEDGGAGSAGRAYLFSGADGALLSTLTSPNAETLGAFGRSVAGTSDVDGDGLGDLLVGAWSEDGHAGRAYLFGTAPNQPPVADAGSDQKVVVGHAAILDGSGSTDPDGDELVFTWTLATPTGSSATLSDATAEKPSFCTDEAGTYTATLTASDAQVSDTDEVEVEAVGPNDALGEVIVHEVRPLGPVADGGDGTLNKGQTKALVRKLEQAQQLLGKGQARGALGVLSGFTVQVRGFQAGGVLSEPQGASLLAAVDPVTEAAASPCWAETLTVQSDHAPAAVVASARSAGPDMPETFALRTAYPNPFARSTRLGFDVPQAARVRVAVYDVLGREVAVLTDGSVEAGRQTVVFDATGLPSGTYFVRLASNGFAETRQLTILR